MNYYRIKSIAHSGRKEERNTPRTDGRYPLRINRIIEFDERDIKIGHPFYIYYIKDENGNDYIGWLVTSMVVDWDYTYENIIRIETLNSIYEFEKVELEGI